MFGSDTDVNTKTQNSTDTTPIHNSLDFLQYQSSSSKEKNHTNNVDIISDSIFEIADTSIGSISNQMNVKELNIFEAKNEPNFASLGVDIEVDDDFGDFEDASTSQGITGCDTVVTINTSLSISPIQDTAITSNPSIQNRTITSNPSYIDPLFSNNNKSLHDPESPKFNEYGEFSTTTTTTEKFSEPTTPLDIPPNILDSKNEGMESENLSINHLKSPISSLNHDSKSPISIERKEILNTLASNLTDKKYYEEAYCCLQINPSLISERNQQIWTQLTFGENKGHN
jgi:hypothetical protein